MEKFDLIIIGAGPAGLTSALYASRAGVNVMVLEKGAAGGKVFLTDEVENYPGFGKIKGRELAALMKENSLTFGAKYQYGDVEKIKENENGTYIVETNMGNYETKSIIAATGMINRKIGIKGESELEGKGVSYCAICDGNFFKGKDVVVVGGGNSALEEALYLADICNTVTIVHRRDEFRAEQYIVDHVLNKENIKFEYDSIPLTIDGEEVVTGITIENIKTKEVKILKTNAVFIYIGFIPLTNIFAELGILDEHKNIEVDKNMRTNKKFIYGAGDVIDKQLRQITTAVNDGSIAAQSAIGDLK